MRLILFVHNYSLSFYYTKALLNNSVLCNFYEIHSFD